MRYETGCMRLACMFLLTMVLSACGGSSDDGGTNSEPTPPEPPKPEPQTNGQRLSKVVSDLDLNGTPDSVSTYSYNDAMRTVTMETIYTDDGTPDEFRFGDDAITQVNSTITFTESGLIESFRIENTYDDGRTEIISFEKLKSLLGLKFNRNCRCIL